MAANGGLERFVEAQEGKAERGVPYATALSEMIAGVKEECWIWYVFPQYIDRTGDMNVRYQIRSASEARDYLRHPLLGRRYAEISAAVLAALGKRSVTEVMGWEIDARKLHQSVSLFHEAAAAESMSELAVVLSAILDAIAAAPYDGCTARADAMTLERWHRESSDAA